jgi:hypothetical protein
MVNKTNRFPLPERLRTTYQLPHHKNERHNHSFTKLALDLLTIVKIFIIPTTLRLPNG